MHNDVSKFSEFLIMVPIKMNYILNYMAVCDGDIFQSFQKISVAPLKY